MIETDLSNMPVKVLYRRMWEYSLDVESEDRQIINDLLEKIDRIQLGEKTDMGIEDYTDLIVLNIRTVQQSSTVLKLMSMSKMTKTDILFCPACRM